ncbi:MAG: hypothetical protein KUG53_00380 [Pseudomonadales bacterium]|nr:hypothetical protein [Pseudomonadales bacterium]
MAKIKFRAPTGTTDPDVSNEMLTRLQRYVKGSAPIGLLGSMILTIAYTEGYAQTFSNRISQFFLVSAEIGYWLFFLIGSAPFLVISFYLLYKAFETHKFSKRDWKDMKFDMNKKRKVYDFGKGKMVPIIIPKYIYFGFLAICIYGVIMPIDYMVVDPLINFLHVDGNAESFRLKVNQEVAKYFFSKLYLFIFTPPLAVLVIIVWLASILKIERK